MHFKLSLNVLINHLRNDENLIKLHANQKHKNENCNKWMK